LRMRFTLPSASDFFSFGGVLKGLHCYRRIPEPVDRFVSYSDAIR
jgi:hypothetical protein